LSAGLDRVWLVYPPMRNTLVHTNSVVPKRVINAWTMGAQEQLIADATVIGDRLLVLSCAIEKLEVPFDSLPALKRISINQYFGQF